MGVTGLEPVTSSLSSNGHPVASEDNKGLATTPPPVCTRVCTNKGENANADAPGAGRGVKGDEPPSGAVVAEASVEGRPDGQDPLALLAAAIGELSPDDRARLARMLVGE